MVRSQKSDIFAIDLHPIGRIAVLHYAKNILVLAIY